MRLPHWGIAPAAVVLMSLPVTAQYEGLRTRAYLDPVGIPTICYGETENVKMGDEKTKQECADMLTAKLGIVSMEVKRRVNVPMSVETHAALVSFTYNVGIGAFERSTLLKKLNAGDKEGACNELLKWNKAGGKVLPGLVKRREAERKLCLS